VTSPTLESQSLYEEFTGRGVTLYATDRGTLGYRSKSPLDENDIERLKEHKASLLNLVGRENIASPSVPCVPLGDKADTYGDSEGTQRGDAKDKGCVPLFVREEQERLAQRASELGLVAKWSRDFGWVSVHDPTTGEWHEVTTKDGSYSRPPWSNPWMLNECQLRKRLWKEGRRDAFELSSAALKALAAREPSDTPVFDPGIVDPHEQQTSDGLIYEDYLREEE